MSEPTLPPGHHQCLMMCGPDRRMDQKGTHNAPANPLPMKCQTCRFVDLDFVPQPYLLCKGIDTPVDMAPAEVGNFLVRERVRRVLETVAPGQCEFYPTQNQKTKEATPWFLAVPQQLLSTVTVKQSTKRCPACGEPDSCNGSQYEKHQDILPSPFDVFKSRNWTSAADRYPRYEVFDYFRKCVDHRHALSLNRDFFFSVRLDTLFKKLGVRGLVRYWPGAGLKPTADDLAWVQEKLHQLNGASLGTSPSDAGQDVKLWFADYLKAKAKKQLKAPDFAAIENAHGLELPADYKEFIAKVGTKTFKNMDGEEGFNIRIMPPKDLDFHELRKTRRAGPEFSDKAPVDAVVFAATEHGDALCFDITEKNCDYPVFLYEHEMDDFEPFTVSFAACIKRLAQA
jgi:hypothetical protein